MRCFIPETVSVTNVQVELFRDDQHWLKILVDSKDEVRPDGAKQPASCYCV